jgi:hypothetical protein
MGLTVDQKAATTADAFAAIVLKGHRPLTGTDQPFIEPIEGLQQRQIGTHLLQAVGFKPSRLPGPLLTPNSQGEAQGGAHR